MELEEIILGFLTYKEKEYPFYYRGNILSLMPATQEVWEQDQQDAFDDIFQNWNFGSNRWIDIICLKGHTQNGYEISFYVNENYNSNMGFISFSVQYIFQYKDMLDTQIDGFYLTGNEINYFFEPERMLKANVKREGDVIQYVTTENGPVIEEYIGEYTDDAVRVRLYWENVISMQFASWNPVRYFSRIRISFDKPQNVDFVLKTYKHCLCLFQYLCARKNIIFDNIQILTGTDIPRNLGVVKILWRKLENESHRWRRNYIIKYRQIGNKVCDLMKEFSLGAMYLEHLCPSVESRNRYETNRIILILVAFEREFENIYGKDYGRSEKYIATKQEMLQYIKKIIDKETGNRKKYFNSFYHIIDNMDNAYCQKVKHALNDCKDLISSFVIKGYNCSDRTMLNDQLFKDISDRLNQLRNDYAHGNLDVEIMPIHITDLQVIQCLTYMIRLKNLGMEPAVIRQCIGNMLGYSGL